MVKYEQVAKSPGQSQDRNYSFLTPSSSPDAWSGATSIKTVAKTNSEGAGL